MSENLVLGRGRGGLSSRVFEGLWDVMFAPSKLQQMWEGSVAGRKLRRSPGPLEPPRWILNPRYLRSLDPCARSLVPKFVARVGFQACISLLSITEQPFPITSGGQFTVSHRKWSRLGSWLKKKKKNYIQYASLDPFVLWIHLAAFDQIRHICPQDMNQ